MAAAMPLTIVAAVAQPASAAGGYTVTATSQIRATSQTFTLTVRK